MTALFYLTQAARGSFYEHNSKIFIALSLTFVLIYDHVFNFSFNLENKSCLKASKANYSAHCLLPLLDCILSVINPNFNFFFAQHNKSTKGIREHEEMVSS